MSRKADVMRWGRVTAGNANLIIQNKRRWGNTVFVVLRRERSRTRVVSRILVIGTWDL